MAAQLYNRQVELSANQEIPLNSKPSTYVLKSNSDGKTTHITINGLIFSTLKPNNFCFAFDNIIKITNIYMTSNTLYFEGKIIKNLQPLFDINTIRF